MKLSSKAIILFPSMMLFLILASCCSVNSGDSEEINYYQSLSVEELIVLLQDQKSAEFSYITEELARRGASAKEAAPYLAEAITYPRRDSTLAGDPLIAMREEARMAIPQLIKNLDSQRADVRDISLIALGAIGPDSKCAIKHIALLLWDSDPYVRETAVGALEEITGEDIEEYIDGLDFESPWVRVPDEPEGFFTQQARIWWNEEGINLNWDTYPDYCDILQE